MGEASDAGGGPAPSSRRRHHRRRKWWSPAWWRRHRSRRRATWGQDARRQGRRRARLAWFALAGLGLTLVVVAAIGYRDLAGVQSQLTTARDSLQQAVDNPATLRTAEGRAAAKIQIERAVGSIGTARRQLTGSAVLSLTRPVPGLGAQRAGLLTLIDDLGIATKVGQDVLTKVDALAQGTQLRGGQVPVDAVRALSTDGRAAAQEIGALARSAGGLWGPVGQARRRFDEVARSNSTRLFEGADALDAALGFMAADGRRRYLVALQNNAEMRDQGMVLSYAVVRFDRGKYTLERNGTVRDLALTGPTPTPVPEGTSKVFGPIGPTQLWQSVNATADFAFSGRAMADMYRQATGEQVDGIIGIDVPALAAVLAVTGPVQVAGIAEPVWAGNVARVLLHDLYVGLGPGDDQGGRREKLSELLRVVSDRLTSGSFDVVALGRSLGDAAAGRHFQLWSGNTQEESVFERTGLGGGPAVSAADRTMHVAVENATATKLDFFVKPAVRQEVELGEDGTAVVRTTVVVDNQAPVGAQPSYQLGPDQYTKRPGDYRAWILLWAPAGSINGAGTPESGLVLSQHMIEVGPGQRRELTFESVIPRAVRDGELTLRLVPQPRLYPMNLQMQLKAPGWHVHSATSWSGPLDRVRTVTWQLSR